MSSSAITSNSQATKRTVTHVITRHAKGLTEEQVRAAVRAMEKLKAHPREEAENRFLLARAERVFKELPAELRRDSLRFALGVEGVATAVVGMRTVKELEQNVEWATAFEPLTAAESKALKKQTVALAREWGPHLDRLDAKGETTRPLVNT